MKLPRHAAILELVRTHRIPSQEALRELLLERGIDVAQATLSRDIRDLGLVKAPDEHGGAYIIPPTGGDSLAPVRPGIYAPVTLTADLAPGSGKYDLIVSAGGDSKKVSTRLDHGGGDVAVVLDGRARDTR